MNLQSGIHYGCHMVISRRTFLNYIVNTKYFKLHSRTGEIMPYCSKCGQRNPDDARFCNKCGSSLGGPHREHRRKHDDQCEENCAGGKRGASVFWAIIVILVGFFILIEVLKNTVGAPDWLEDLEFWWIIGVVIGIAIIITGIKILTSDDNKPDKPY